MIIIEIDWEDDDVVGFEALLLDEAQNHAVPFDEGCCCEIAIEYFYIVLHKLFLH
jgi:hypothetical protein